MCSLCFYLHLFKGDTEEIYAEVDPSLEGDELQIARDELKALCVTARDACQVIEKEDRKVVREAAIVKFARIIPVSDLIHLFYVLFLLLILFSLSIFYVSCYLFISRVC